ncbi:hypothetical protein L2E82_17362 [Cichorium intybus]|uniref:Uncharacterized protein n=1 Tax=Cichorium intybus TaxID=13427 RepID=A0ACB9F8Q1_CICIN|nr:hypothetical protein L2E82_17362 [Cichorium intybus]
MFAGKKAAPVWNLPLPVKMNFSENSKTIQQDETDHNHADEATVKDVDENDKKDDGQVRNIGTGDDVSNYEKRESEGTPWVYRLCESKTHEHSMNRKP